MHALSVAYLATSILWDRDHAWNEVVIGNQIYQIMIYTSKSIPRLCSRISQPIVETVLDTTDGSRLSIHAGRAHDSKIIFYARPLQSYTFASLYHYSYV